MNTLKSAIARTAIAVAFVLTGCASLGPSDQSESTSAPYDNYGGF